MSVSFKSPARPAGVETGSVPGRAGDTCNTAGMPHGRGSRSSGSHRVSASVEKHGHSRCLLCGESNPWSLKLSFFPVAGGVAAHFKAHPGLQGYRGILHGGVTASLLDAAMTHCLFHHGVEALTADLHVRYAHAIPCDAHLEIRASLTVSRPPLFILRAQVIQDGRLMARGEGKFLLKDA